MSKNKHFQPVEEHQDLDQRSDAADAPAQTELSRRTFLQAAIGGVIAAPLLTALSPGKASAASSTTLFATADTFIRRDLPNRNDGANLRLRVGGSKRTLLQFDATDLANAVRHPGFKFISAHLVLDVAADVSQGAAAGVSLDAHPLLRDFAEGNGGAAGSSFGFGGFGQRPVSGATWNSFADSNTRDNKPDPFTAWAGGTFGRAALSGLVPAGPFVRGQELRWDVSSDVLAGHSDWLVKLSREAADGVATGDLEFYSREGARNVTGAMPPRLELVMQPRIAATPGADTSLWRIELDASVPGQPVAALKVSINGGEFQDFKLKGICYSPIPIGSSFSFAPAIGDFFWDSFSVNNYQVNGWDPLWARDLPRIRALGANTIRVYNLWSHQFNDDGSIPDPDSAAFQGRLRTHKKFLDACWNNGDNPIYVLAGIATPEVTWWKERYVEHQGGQQDAATAKFWDRVVAETAKQLAGHPAILGFTLFNELADGPHAYAETTSGITQARANELTEFFWERVQTMAALVKGIAPGKLVGVALHDNPNYAGFKGAPYLATIPSVDFYGVNTYQPFTLDPVFRAVPSIGNGYNGLTGPALKPVIITEFGMPGTGHRDSNDRTSIYEDATTRQRAAEIVGHIVPKAMKEPLCLGLYYFEYCDEWWKTASPSFQWIGGNKNLGFANCYGDEAGFGLYSVALGPGLPANSPPYVDGPAAAGPRLPIDVHTERTEMTAALKASFAGENPYPNDPRLCGR